MRITLVIEDNPLAGRQDQPDFVITISGEPPIDFGEGEELPDPETLSPALCAALEMLSHLTGLTAEAAFVKIATGGHN